jgi:hypothetical protein
MSKYGQFLKGVIGGLILIGIAVWIGFIGWTSTEYGPQGHGVYQITYPIFGIGGVIVGIIMIFGGISAIFFGEEPEPRVPFTERAKPPSNELDDWRSKDERGNQIVVIGMSKTAVCDGCEEVKTVLDTSQGLLCKDCITELKYVISHKEPKSISESKLDALQTETTTEQPNSKIQCPHCATLIPSDSTFCNNCGGQLIRRGAQLIWRRAQ